MALLKESSELTSVINSQIIPSNIKFHTRTYKFKVIILQRIKFFANAKFQRKHIQYDLSIVLL